MTRVCQRCQHQNTPEAKFCLQCGAMLEVEVENAADPLIGKILLGRYRVSRVLGEGGMGKVYLAEQKMGTAVRKVAIKTLHPELSNDPQIVARFHRECETVIELHHPNTVQFYDFGELEDKTLFIVMEFIEGEDLAHTLRRGTLEPARCDRVLIQVCGSLHEAHQRGIVHRDLKPENIYLTQRGGQQDFVKVLDFGIAKRNEAEDESKGKLTKQGMVLGTPPYMSPEQFSGQALDARSDIYSLGVMTYEMITGHLPFDARTPWEWATKHLTQAPTPLESYPQGAALAPHKKSAIMRALAKNRDERHADVLAFMQEFTGLADPQSAWTLATSAGIKSSNMGAPQAQAFAGAPGMSPPSQPGFSAPPSYPSQPGLGAPVASPPYGQAAAGAAYGAGPTSPPYGQPQNSPPYGQPQNSPPYGQPTPGFGQPASPPYGQPQTGGYAQAAPYGTDPSMNATGGVGGGTTSPGVGKILGIVFGGIVLLGAIGGGAFVLLRKETVTSVDAGAGAGGPGPEPIAREAADAATEPATVDAATVVAAAEPDASAGTTTTETPQNPPDAGETAMQEPPGETSSMNEHASASNAPSSAELDRAKQDAEDAVRRAASRDVDGAILSLASAQRHVGSSHPILRPARAAVAALGSATIANYMFSDQCGRAQALYRKLSSVGASGASRQHFSDWCPRP